MNRHNWEPISDDQLVTSCSSFEITRSKQRPFRRPTNKNLKMGILSRRAAAAKPMPTSNDEPQQPVPQLLQEATTENLKGGGKVTSKSVKIGDVVEVTVKVEEVDLEDGEKVALHWGLIKKEGGGWIAMKEEDGLPERSSLFGKEAVTTVLDGKGLFMVRIDGGEEGVWGQVRFVVKTVRDGGESRWFQKSGGGDFCVGLVWSVDGGSKVGGMNGDKAGEVLLEEETSGRVTLFSRYGTALGVLGNDEVLGNEDVLAWIFVILRLSGLKYLSWYQGYNYQPKDMDGRTDCLSRRLGHAAVFSNNMNARMFARLALGFTARGGGNGDDIRMGILHIMRAHGIKEGHRPGIECKFLESWHQKLHQNSTADDIHICSGYIAFLQSGNVGDLYHVAWESGRLSRDDMRSFRQPITYDPLHLPQLTNDMKGYLWTLKKCHAGADLDFIANRAQWALDDSCRGTLSDILSNRSSWDIIGKIAGLRHGLRDRARHVPYASRDVTFLDIALSRFLKTKIDEKDQGSMSIEELKRIVSILLEQGDPEDEDMRVCSKFWNAIDFSAAESGDQYALLKAVAAIERVSAMVALQGSSIYQLTQSKADKVGHACNLKDSMVRNFAEEVIRGELAFSISSFVRELESRFRKSGGLANWQVVSACPASGVLREFSADEDRAQLANLSPPTGKDGSKWVLIVDELDGSEDLSDSIAAVLTPSVVDVLSHIGIRARNQEVLLATCFVEESLNEIRKLTGNEVEVSIDGGGHVSVARESKAEPKTQKSSTILNGTATMNKEIAKGESNSAKTMSGKHIQLVRSVDLKSHESVGGKSGGIGKLISLKESGVLEMVNVPYSIALPYGSFEDVLASKSNTKVLAKMKELEKAASESYSNQDHVAMSSHLKELRELVENGLDPSEALDSLITELATHFMEQLDGNESVPDAEDSLWTAVCQVWASTWTDRAFSFRSRMSMPKPKMAVLMQPVIPARYAFVLHTVSPVSKDEDEMYGEVVCGLGETLVSGSYSGRAFSFNAKKGNPDSARVLSFPSKRIGLFTGSQPALFVRSDSSGEDREDFAGAGQYDSVTTGRGRTEERFVDYSAEPLVWSDEERSQLLEKLVRCGTSVEQSFAGPVDIEGVVTEDGSITIVQARPQIL